MMFEHIKVGDQVIVILRSPFLNQSLRRIALVEKVTTTQFVAEKLRFSKRHGYQIGGDNRHPARAVPATPELIEQVRLEGRFHEEQRTMGQLFNTIAALHLAINRDYASNEYTNAILRANQHLAAAIKVLKASQEKAKS
jgi:hypothetical protein